MSPRPPPTQQFEEYSDTLQQEKWSKSNHKEDSDISFS